MNRQRDERGSISAWALVSVAAFMLIVGLSVDLGGRMYAIQHINDIAAEAARAGAQQVTAADAMRGRPVAVDPTRARTAALSYITTAGLTGTATLTGDTLHVSATGHHTPTFLGAFGIGTVTITGTADARIARALNGTER